MAAPEQPSSSPGDPPKGPPPDIKLKLPTFKAQPTDRPQTLAQVKPVLGVPTLVLDGKPYGPMIYTRCAGTLDQLAEARSALIDRPALAFPSAPVGSLVKAKGRT